MSHTLQRALQSGQEAGSYRWISAFDRDNHQGILYKLCSEGIGGSGLPILALFLSNRPKHVMLGGCRSKLFNVASGVPQGSVLDPLLVPSIHLGAFFHSGE